MKTKSLLWVIMTLLSIKTMAQADITVDASYLPYESTILIHLVNNTDNQMRIYNSDEGTTGSFIQFSLKDKNGKEISLRTVVYYEGVDYQRIVNISPHSTKTIKYPLKFLCPSSRSVSEIYSIDASCFVNYSIPERKRFDNIDKVLSIKTQQDLMIYRGYDSYAKRIMITLSNTSDHEMIVHNGGTYIQFRFLNQQRTILSARDFPFILRESRATPYKIKIAPHSSAELAYQLGDIGTGLAEAEIAMIEIDCSAIYDIPAQNLTNQSSKRVCIIAIKHP